jgi:protein gp37
MAQFSPIGWTGGSWNVNVGCFYAGKDCIRCYLAPAAIRLSEKLKIAKYDGVARAVNGRPVLTGKVNLGGDVLIDLPRHWKRPQKIFVNSMSDMFHDAVPLEQIQAMFKVMWETPRHLYQILTKRAERLAELAPLLDWAPNIWIGVSCGHADYYARIRLLQTVPTPNRFLFLEPMIGPLAGIMCGLACP